MQFQIATSIMTVHLAYFQSEKALTTWLLSSESGALAKPKKGA
jgi:hypothetical protein